MRKKVICLLTAVMIMGALVIADCPVSNAKVYKLEKTYTFTGKVHKVRWKHISGIWRTSYILTLKKKIKIKGYIEKEKKVEIWSKKCYKKFKKCVGKKVKVKGKLFDHGSSYYYTSADLQVLEIKRCS